MKVYRSIFSILSLSLLVSLVRSFLYDIFKCKCDYYLPTFIVAERQCGYCATCYWALEFYLTQMGYPPDNDLQLPSITELQTKWQTIMMNYEEHMTRPKTKEEGCKTELQTCEGLMKKLIINECNRLESSLKVGEQLIYPSEEEDAYPVKIYFSRRFMWGTNWTGYFTAVIHPNQNPYIIKCPTGFFLGSYHFTLSYLLNTKNIEYFGTMMLYDLLHFIPKEQKKMYTCNAVEWVRLNLLRNVTEYKENFCRQKFSKDRSYDGYVCDTEDDPVVKEEINKGLPVFCENAYNFTVVGGNEIIDYNMDAHHEKECDLRNDCEVMSDQPQLQ